MPPPWNVNKAKPDGAAAFAEGVTRTDPTSVVEPAPDVRCRRDGLTRTIWVLQPLGVVFDRAPRACRKWPAIRVYYVL